MALAARPFEHVAEVVTEKVTELLCTEVSIVDPHGIVVASSDSRSVGHPFDANGERLGHGTLRFPLHLGADLTEVIISEPKGGEPLPPHLAQALVELIVNQTAIVDQLPNKDEIKNKLIHDLLHGPIDDEAAVLREAQVLGMDLSTPRVVILIDAADYVLAPASAGVEPDDADIQRRAQLVISSVVDFFLLPTDTICAYIGHGEVAVLKASNRKNLGIWVDGNHEQDHLNPSWANLTAVKRAGLALLTRLHNDTRAPISIGVGRYHPGLRGLGHSYQDARAALSLGRRFHGHNQVHCLDGLGIASFVGVSDERTKVDLAKYLLSPLDHEPELLTTLDTFFAHDCCPSKTAETLHIHRNTLTYRLDKITSLLGLDPRRFDDAVQIRLSLVLRSLQDDPRSRALAQ